MGLQEGTDVEGKGLYQSASNSDVKSMKRLLAAYTGPDFLEYQNNSQNTALIMACGVTREKFAEDMVTMLLNAGCNYEHKNKVGWTPLMTAAKRGFPTVCKLLLAKGANMNEEDPKGKKAIDLTRDPKTREVFSDVLKAIEKAKYAAEIARKGKVVWDYISKDKINGLRELVEMKQPPPKEAFDWYAPKPKPKVVVVEVDDRPKTALEKALAESGNKKDKMRAMIAAKKAKAAKEDLAKKAPKLKSTIPVVISIHQPPLIYAVEKRNQQLAELLLEGGADVNVALEGGMTPGWTALHKACHLPRLHAWPETKKSVQREQTRAKIVQDLIDFDANVNKADALGRTPLHVAAEKGHFDLIDLLIMEEAASDPRDKRKDTPLMLACRRGVTSSIKALIDGGANVNLAGCDQMTSLMWAAYHGRLDHIATLLEGGADLGINMRSAFGQTALFWAIDQNKAFAVMELLKVETLDPNVPLKSGTPPLVAACRQNLPVDTVAAMLEKGADPNGRGFDGTRALHWSVLNVNEPLMRVMLYAGANPLLENTNGLNAVEMAVTVKMRMMLAEAAEMYKEGKKNLTAAKK